MTSLLLAAISSSSVSVSVSASASLSGAHGETRGSAGAFRTDVALAEGVIGRNAGMYGSTGRGVAARPSGPPPPCSSLNRSSIRAEALGDG